MTRIKRSEKAQNNIMELTILYRRAIGTGNTKQQVRIMLIAERNPVFRRALDREDNFALRSLKK